jgi:hypothetical protein
MTAPRSADYVPVTGVWLRRVGDYAEVLAEVDGEWRLIIKEHVDGHFSHIVEPSGIHKAPPDYVDPRHAEWAKHSGSPDGGAV